MAKTTNFFNDVQRVLKWGYKKRKNADSKGNKFFSWIGKHMRR